MIIPLTILSQFVPQRQTAEKHKDEKNNNDNYFAPKPRLKLRGQNFMIHPVYQRNMHGHGAGVDDRAQHNQKLWLIDIE